MSMAITLAMSNGLNAQFLEKVRKKLKSASETVDKVTEKEDSRYKKTTEKKNH